MAIKLDEIQEKIKNAQTRILSNKGRIISIEDNALHNAQRDGKTRSALTITFLIGFFVLIVGCFFFVLLYNSYAVDWITDLNKQGLKDYADKITLLELDKVLAVIIGALGTSLGFIIGYYFKDKNQ